MTKFVGCEMSTREFTDRAEAEFANQIEVGALSNTRASAAGFQITHNPSTGGA